jgi:hypothetical protein
VAVVGEAVEKRLRHLGVAEHAGSFAEAEIGHDDDAGAFIELAQQVEEQGTARGAERQVAKLVEDDENGMGEPRRNLAGLALALFRFERVVEFDGGEEPDALSVMLDHRGVGDQAFTHRSGDLMTAVVGITRVVPHPICELR